MLDSREEALDVGYQWEALSVGWQGGGSRCWLVVGSFRCWQTGKSLWELYGRRLWMRSDRRG